MYVQPTRPARHYVCIALLFARRDSRRSHYPSEHERDKCPGDAGDARSAAKIAAMNDYQPVLDKPSRSAAYQDDNRLSRLIFRASLFIRDKSEERELQNVISSRNEGRSHSGDASLTFRSARETRVAF